MKQIEKEYQVALAGELYSLMDQYEKRIDHKPIENHSPASADDIYKPMSSFGGSGAGIGSVIPIPFSTLIFAGVGALVGFIYGCYEYHENHLEDNAYKVKHFLETEFKSSHDSKEILLYLAGRAIEYRKEKIDQLAENEGKENKNINRDLVAHYFAVNIMEAIKHYQQDPLSTPFDVAGAGLAKHESGKGKDKTLRNKDGSSISLKALAEFGIYRPVAPAAVSRTEPASPSIISY